MQTELFTPRLSPTSDERMEMKISREDFVAYRESGRGQYKRGTVTDTVTGRAFEVRSAPCAADCYCDAVIVQEMA